MYDRQDLHLHGIFPFKCLLVSPLPYNLVLERRLELLPFYGQRPQRCVSSIPPFEQKLTYTESAIAYPRRENFP